LQKGTRSGSRKDALHHVRDIEDGGVFAGEGVRCRYGEGSILHGHVKAAEGDHLGAMGEMEVVEGGFLEGGV
jgi:hypothetical protein